MVPVRDLPGTFFIWNPRKWAGFFLMFVTRVFSSDNSSLRSTPRYFLMRHFHFSAFDLVLVMSTQSSAYRTRKAGLRLLRLRSALSRPLL